MKQGFEQRQKYEFDLHVQTLRSIRMSAYANVRMHTKKINKAEQLWGLPLDKRVDFNHNTNQDRIKMLAKKWSKSIPQHERKSKEEILKIA